MAPSAWGTVINVLSVTLIGIVRSRFEVNGRWVISIRIHLLIMKIYIYICIRIRTLSRLIKDIFINYFDPTRHADINIVFKMPPKNNFSNVN